MPEIEVTDPELLKALNAGSGGKEVTDPELLKQLNAAPSPAAALDDPYSARSTIGRVTSDIVTGLPDLAIKIHNAGLNPFTLPQRAGNALADYLTGTTTPAPAPVPEVGPYVRKAIGVPDLPEDAGPLRRYGEAAATMLGSVGTGAPAASRSLIRDVAAPLALSSAGGAVGGAVGGDTGALIGSVAGGLYPSARAQMASRGARPDAAEIAAAAERQGVKPTAGMLGDLNIQARERNLSGRPGAAGVISNARTSALDQMREAVARAIEERQALPAATPETADIHGVASAARAGGTDASSAAQTRLLEKVGPRTPVDVTDLYASLGRILNQTDPGSAAPVATRMGHIRDMAEQYRTLDTLQRGGPVDPNAPLAVPYEQFKDWRTALGRRMQNLDPVPGRFANQIYEDATTAMRDAATARGVHPQEFALAQDITKGQMRAGDIQEQFDRSLGDTMASAAGPRKFARWWSGMTPEEQARIGGAQAPTLADVSRLAGAYNYPTAQTGLTRAFGGQLADVGSRAVGAALGSLLGKTGLPGGYQIGAAAGAAGMTPINWLRAKMLEGGKTRAMAAGPRPMTIDDLIASMQAANIGAR